ncbi:DUF4288 domain-containing protein [Dactylosporangium maewongense]
MDERGAGSLPVWFSATARFALYTEDAGYYLPSVSVYTFKATDHAGALVRALELGRAAEQAYVNAHGVRVRVALVEVESVNMIGDDLDGAEVFWWPGEEQDASPYAWDHTFTPERSTPHTAL